MNNRFSFRCEPYMMKVNVFYNCPYIEMKKYATRKHGTDKVKEAQFSCDDIDEQTGTFIDGNVYIWFKKIEVFSIDELQAFTHECSHAAMYILSYVNVPITYQDDEAFCYAQDYIFGKLIRKFNKIFNWNIQDKSPSKKIKRKIIK